MAALEGTEETEAERYARFFGPPGGGDGDGGDGVAPVRKLKLLALGPVTAEHGQPTYELRGTLGKDYTFLLFLPRPSRGPGARSEPPAPVGTRT